MIYSVELDWRFDDAERARRWEEWYEHHLRRLISVPGIGSAQRFRSIRPARSPYLALYSISGMDVFDSERYRALAGPNSSKEFHDCLSDWFRNVFDGVASAPRVGADELLLMLDQDTPPGGPAPPFAWLTAIGHDRKPPHRGIAVVRRGEENRYLGSDSGLRAFEPLSDYLEPRP